MRSFLTVMASLLVLSGCAAHAPPEAEARLTNPLIAAEMNPQLAARQNYVKAVADYQSCVGANSLNPNACEELRHIMDEDAQILSDPNVSANIRFHDKRYSYTD
jgi:hypothetical protein